MNTIKDIFGWVLILAGLAVIGWSIYFSYQFFFVKAEFPALFKFPAAAQNVAPETKQNIATDSQADVQAQMQKEIGQATNQAVSNMLPADSISKLLNSIAWSIFATFLVYTGAQIAGIGIKLIS
jgi:hypothetical protein